MCLGAPRSIVRQTSGGMVHLAHKRLFALGRDCSSESDDSPDNELGADHNISNQSSHDSFLDQGIEEFLSRRNHDEDDDSSEVTFIHDYSI